MKQLTKILLFKSLLIFGIINPLLSFNLNATEFTVDSTLDLPDAIPGDGICQSALPEMKCTLRAALDEANSLPNADIINLPAGEYIQTSPLNSQEFKISNSLEIIGADPLTTIVNGNALNHVFYIRQSELTSTISISNLQLTNAGTGVIYAGGITNLNLNNIVINGKNSGGDTGIDITPPTTGNSSVIITNSIIENNSPVAGATIGGGAVVFISQTATASLVIKNTIIRNNIAVLGGGLYLVDGITTVVNSTISNNTATTSAGGIFAGPKATLHIVNSTISGNKTNGSGGGIDTLLSLEISLNNTTITDNHADFDIKGGGFGGGLAVGFINSGVITAINSIIAGNINHNTDINAASPDCYILGTLTPAATDTKLNLIGYNILGDRTTCNIIEGTGNQIGNSFTAVDAVLGPLKNNGGPTETHSLLAGSPAIDAGNPNGCTDQDGINMLATDQRGFDRHSDGGIGSARCDIGSVEITDTTPIANVGADQVVAFGATVTLDGSASQTFIGNTISFNWVQMDNKIITLTDPTLAKTTFTAPTTASTLVFQLTVTDEFGQMSSPSDIVITVSGSATGGGGNSGAGSNGGGSSGGCNVNKTAGFDPVFILLLFIGILFLYRRKKLTN